MQKSLEQSITLLCASAPYDMIQHFLIGSRNSAAGLQTSHRKMEEGSVKAREATHLVLQDGVLLAAQRHGGGFCFRALRFRLFSTSHAPGGLFFVRIRQMQE